MALIEDVRAAVAACEENGRSDPRDDQFRDGWTAAHRKLGEWLSGALDRDPRALASVVASVEQERDNPATDAKRAEWLHRLLGNLRKL